MSQSRLRAGSVRRYFIDSPDPESLVSARGRLAEADASRTKALDRTHVEAECRKLRDHRLIGAGLCVAVLLVCVLSETHWLGFLSAIGAFVCAVRAFVSPRQHAAKAGEAMRGALAEAEWRRSEAEAAIHEYQRLYDLAEPKPSDEAMDRMLEQDVEAVRARAMRSLSLDTDDLVRPIRAGAPDDVDWSPFNSSSPQKPLVVYGPAFGEGLKVSSAVGKDGRRRYGRYSVMVICTTRYHIAVYRCVLDFFTGQLNHESTMEMHYQDVVSVRTHSDPDPGRRIEIEIRESQKHLFPRGTERCFELIVSGGITLRMVTGLTHRETTDFRTSGEGGVVYQGEDPDFQAVADAVRMMLREKKGGVEGPSLFG
ncbi:hypothetical protein ABZ565_15440 [Streptomyces sp. NPDC016469]|uniref:hypothetical protein n=1 Tax=Streptomyces sp. NPDC016469 TaxID=3157191 RepID=UPI0033EDF968